MGSHHANDVINKDYHSLSVTSELLAKYDNKLKVFGTIYIICITIPHTVGLCGSATYCIVYHICMVVKRASHMGIVVYE